MYQDYGSICMHLPMSFKHRVSLCAVHFTRGIHPFFCIDFNVYSPCSFAGTLPLSYTSGKGQGMGNAQWGMLSNQASNGYQQL
jgi:hypothetical protein